MSLRARLAWLALLCAACAGLRQLRAAAMAARSAGSRACGARPRCRVEPVWHVFNGDFFTNVLVFLPIGFSPPARSRRDRPGAVKAVHPMSVWPPPC